MQHGDHIMCIVLIPPFFQIVVIWLLIVADKHIKKSFLRLDYPGYPGLVRWPTE